MKNNILIPRKDHEIYFIPVDRGVKRKDPHPFISGRLRELHPGFSPSTVFDLKKVTLKDKTWYVVTVMRQETLMEYRLLHRGVSFFTATGLLVYTKDFIKGPVYHLPEETIGFDAEHETPVSVPGIASGYTRNEPLPPDRVSKLLEQANGLQGIFRKKQSPLFFLLPGVVLLAAVFFVLPPYGRASDTPAPGVQPEASERLQPLPTAFELLAQAASVVRSGNGVIYQVQYDERQPVLLSLNLGGIEPGLFFERISALPYVKPSGISGIRYIDDAPQYAASVVLDTDLYHVPYISPLFDQKRLFAVLSALRTGLRDYRVQLVSETLPQHDNTWCTISVSVSAPDFIKTIEAIEEELERHHLCIRRMVVSYTQDKALFLLTYSFSPYRETGMPVPLLSENKSAILPAFGYMPAPVMQKPAVKADYSAYTKVGVIHSEDGTVTTYYRDMTGKIVVSEE